MYFQIVDDPTSACDTSGNRRETLSEAHRQASIQSDDPASPKNDIFPTRGI